MTKALVLKSKISLGSYEKIKEEILYLPEKKISSYVCIANVHMTIEAYLNDKFLSVVNNADITTPDGMPLAKAIRYLYGISQDRIAGMDLMPDLMSECEKQQKTIFLYGSTSDVLEKIMLKAKIMYPDLKIDFYSPPFRTLSKPEDEEIIKRINDGKYDYVFVALGCPKQEQWMNDHKDKIKCCMIGLGGAFEVFADIRQRAPQWMQNNSLEWLYRFIQDPKRLWKRYFITNSLFVILLLKQYCSVKLFKGLKNEN
jgi:N-acetylglucosaminyldiphosphoundecaprenol N-acetyl-beta-D-mannosaminyltransferase